MNKTRSKFNNLLPGQDLCKRNQNFSLPLSCLQQHFPRVKTVDVIKIIIIIINRCKKERKKEQEQEEWAYTLALTDSADPLCVTVTLKIGNRKTCDFTLISHWQQLLDRENEEFFPQSSINKKVCHKFFNLTEKWAT